MNIAEQRTAIEAAVGLQWDAFAERHPNLARVVDLHLVVEQAVGSLNRNPEYQRAMANARAADADVEVIIRMIDRYVGKFLSGLLPAVG